MSETTLLPIQMQILLLRQKMALQRQLIQQKTTTAENTDQFPRSFGMRLLQQQLSSSSPWMSTLKNKFTGKESALLWSVAFTFGQHWLQKKAQNPQ